MTAREALELVLAGEARGVAERSLHDWRATPPMPRAALYAEPRMQGDRGHFVVLAERYQELLNKQGVQLEVLHQQGWSGDDREGWTGVFPFADHAVSVGGIDQAASLDRCTDFFRRVLLEALRRSGAKLLICPTARWLTIGGMADAADESGAGLLLGVMETWPVPDATDSELVRSAFRRAARRMEQSSGPSMVLAESVPIREKLVALGFNPATIHVHPFPAAGRVAPGRRPQSDRETLRIACLGASRPVHNPGLLARYLLQSRRAGRDWTVKLDAPLAAAELGTRPGDLIAKLEGRGVRVLRGHLPDADYLRELRRLDIMLFPYGGRYATMGSGIFLESISAGIVPLLPKSSSMRRLYRELGGTAPAIETLTPEGIENAIAATERAVSDYRLNAAAVRDAWMQDPRGPVAWSERVGAFVERVLDSG